MKWLIRIGCLSLVVATYVACSPVSFEKSTSCTDGCVQVTPSGTKIYEYNVTVSGGKVDILFVDDNSGSMSFEQNHIASRFSNFISALDAKSLDYRIGIITTDVSSPTNPARAINQNGALQDGRLIAFESNRYFLEPGTANKTALFSNSIRRAETLQCESFLNSNSSVLQNSTVYRDNCPSPDERGIYAASLAVDSNPSGFIRDGAHLAIVFLSDEDVRSQLYDESSAYLLDSRDLPQNLITQIKGKFSGKTVSMHSIIVRPGELKTGLSPADAAEKISQVITGYNVINSANKPENLFLASSADTSCLMAQGNQTNNVSGSYGYLYSLAAKLTGGVIGDICANDYGSQLSDIGKDIGEKVNKVDLACENPKILELKFTDHTGTPGGNIQGSAYYFDPALNPGQGIYLKIECPE